MVECAGLEIRYTVSPYRGFESLLLRHTSRKFGAPGPVLLSDPTSRPTKQEQQARGLGLLLGCCMRARIALDPREALFSRPNPPGMMSRVQAGFGLGTVASPIRLQVLGAVRHQCSELLLV